MSSLRPVVVLDTNVVLDCFHFDDVAARPLTAALLTGRLQALGDESCLAELERVLGYPAFALAPRRQADILRRYRDLVRCLPPATPLASLPRCRDPDDQRFLDLAQRGGVSCLVSKDKALLALHRHPRLSFAIVTPAVAAQQLLNAA